jgi:hypothetical protein
MLIKQMPGFTGLFVVVLMELSYRTVVELPVKAGPKLKCRPQSSSVLLTFYKIPGEV